MNVAQSLRLAVALALVAAAGFSQGTIKTPDVQEASLDNGLRILVIEDRSQPRVACKILTHFGAFVEEPGRLGSAHFLEHLLFKGTATIGTHDWENEEPLLDEILELERELLAERNRSRRELRQRGVFLDHQHEEKTDRIREIEAEIHAKVMEDEPFVDTAEINSYYQRHGGARMTATTEQEYMKFDVNLPSNKLEMFFRVEADRMWNSRFRRFDSERWILWEQRLGDLNNPDTFFKEAVASASGVISPVYWNEGYESDFGLLSRDYTRELYEKWFVPNNTILVLIGDTDLETVRGLADKYFGKLPRGEETYDTLAIEPAPDHLVRVEMETDHFGPAIDMRHRIPGVGHPERATAELMSEILGDPRGPVGRTLIEQGLARSVASNTVVTHTDRFSFPGTANLVVHAVNEGKLEELEHAMVQALEALKRGSLDESVISAAKKRRRLAWENRRLSWDQVAFDLGHYEIMDSWRTLFREMEAVQEVSVEELEAFASKYFVKNNRIVGVATRKEGGAR